MFAVILAIITLIVIIVIISQMPPPPPPPPPSPPPPPPPTACSAQHPHGFCSAGAVCYSGNCIPVGIACTTEQECLIYSSVCYNNNCIHLCSDAAPTGYCPPGMSCITGRCNPTPCSKTYPNGACYDGKQCINGSCGYAACTSISQCPSNYQCNNSQCIPQCTPETAGQPSWCSNNNICDDSGVCVPPQCGQDINNPSNGSCSTGYLCDNGNCVLQKCSKANPCTAEFDVCQPDGTCVCAITNATDCNSFCGGCSTYEGSVCTCCDSSSCP